MNRLQNAWKPLLLGMVLMSVLAGVVGAVPTEKPSALSSQRQLVITAADFYPLSNATQYQYSSNGLSLTTTVNNTTQYFMAPVDFPVPYYATVDKFELFAIDNNSTAGISASLYLSKPSQGTRQYMASNTTGFASADPALLTWQTTSFVDTNVKSPAKDAYVYLQIEDDTGLVFYGVRIYYRAGT